jgi:feruloyl esterase
MRWAAGGRSAGLASLIAVVAVAAGAGGMPAARAQATAPPPEACIALRDLYLHDTLVASASLVEAADDLPTFCRVLGTVRPAITFELRLPVSDWNGKLYMAGCGGFCGSLDADLPGLINAINPGLRRGYAVVTTDAGHWGEGRASGLWGYNNYQAEIDWGYRAVGEVASIAKQIVAAYYAQSSRHTYFSGCGTGGRMGVVAALRYPDAFDGIISGAPFLRHTDVMGVLYTSQAQAVTDAEGQVVLDPAAADTLADAVTAFCDKEDGLVDDLVSAPSACAFDPRTIACKEEDGGACLTTEEVDAALRLYEGARDVEV